MPILVIARGDSIEGEVRLEPRVWRIGRDAANDIVLGDPSRGISRFHAEIHPDAQGYSLVDLGSRNGTWVAGRQVSEVRLEPGQPVSLGPYRLMVQENEAEVPTETGLNVDSAATIPRGMPGVASTMPTLEHPGAVPTPSPAAVRRVPVWSSLAALLVLAAFAVTGVYMWWQSGPAASGATPAAAASIGTDEAPPTATSGAASTTKSSEKAIREAYDDYAKALFEEHQGRRAEATALYRSVMSRLPTEDPVHREAARHLEHLR